MERPPKPSRPLRPFTGGAASRGGRVLSASARVMALPQEVPRDVAQCVVGAAFDELRQAADESEFASKSNSYAHAYNQMLMYTSSLPFPNPLRTSFACALLDRLVGNSIARPGMALVDRLKADIFGSIYLHTKPETFQHSEATQLDAELHRFKAFSLYFTEHRIACEERDAAVGELQAKRATNTKELLLMERIIHRWQSMLLDRLFAAWKNYSKRRKMWRGLLAFSSIRRANRKLVKRSFADWRFNAREQRLRRKIEESERKAAEQASSEEEVLQEYAKLVSGIETMKNDKMMSQEAIKKLSEELAQAKSTIDQLNSRIEQQRAATVSWREVAIGLMKTLSGPAKLLAESSASAAKQSRGRSMSSNLQASQSTNGRSFSLGIGLSLNVSPTTDPLSLPKSSDVDAQDQCILDWVNNSRRVLYVDRLQSSSSFLSEELGAPPALADVTNFSSDFADGNALLDIVEIVKAAPRGAIRPLRKGGATPIRLVSFALGALDDFLKTGPLVEAVDVVAGQKPAALRMLLVRVMAAYSYQCPVCSGGRQGAEMMEDAARSRPSIASISREDTVYTVAEVRSLINQSFEQFQAKREEVEALTAQSLVAFRRECRTEKNGDDVVLQDGLRHVLQWVVNDNALKSYAQKDATITQQVVELCDCSVYRWRRELWELFLKVVPVTGQGMNSDRFAKFLAKCRPLLKTTAAKMIGPSLFDVISQVEGKGGRQITPAGWAAAVAFIVTMNAMGGTTPEDFLKQVGDEFGQFVSTLSASVETNPRGEFEVLLANSELQKTLELAASQLHKAMFQQQGQQGVVVPLIAPSAEATSKQAPLQVTVPLGPSGSASLMSVATHGGGAETGAHGLSRDSLSFQVPNAMQTESESTSSAIAPSAPPGVRLEKFLQSLRDMKIVDTHYCSTEDAKRLFYFVVGETGVDTTMSVKQFAEAVVGLAVMKDPSPWSTVSAKVRNFLKKDLVPGRRERR